MMDPKTPPAPSKPAADPGALQHQFRRCSPETIQAILDFRRSRDPALVEPVVHGILHRYVSPEVLARLQTAPEDVDFQAAGLDSLTLLESLLDVQDALDVTLEEGEVRALRNLEGLVALLRRHVAGGIVITEARES